MQYVIKKIFFICSVFFVYAIDATQLNIQVGGGSRYSKDVAIFWKDGTFGYQKMARGMQTFNSPWNRDILGIRWMEWNENKGKLMHYEFRVNVPAFSWRKQPVWLIIFDNGSITFDTGNGIQERRIISLEEKRELAQDEWAVVNY